MTGFFDGKQARRQRKQARRSVQDVAYAMDVAQDTVRYWERGVFAPDEGQVAALCRLYGCEVEMLVTLRAVRG